MRKESRPNYPLPPYHTRCMRPELVCFKAIILSAFKAAPTLVTSGVPMSRMPIPLTNMMFIARLTHGKIF
jgi:hypothetical protein